MAYVKKLPKYGHWLSMCGDLSDPTKFFGFIYLIFCKRTGKFYIGRKQFCSVTRKTVAGKKRKQVTVKESDWQSYQSSSEYVKADITKYGEDEFDFWIIQTYKTKSGLGYAEANLMHKQDVMHRMLDDKNRLYYNANIPAVRFVSKEFYEEAEKTIAKIVKQRV